MCRTGPRARRRGSSESEDNMENRTLEDLRQGLLDGTLRIRHNGIDIFIDCMETKDMLVIPMTRAEGARRDPRMERMTQDPDDGQGPYKGFLLIVCEECGAVKAFCAKRETYSFRCDECGYETPLENLRPMYMHCKCGESFRYRDQCEVRDHHPHLPARKAPVDMELNRRGTALCDRRHEGRQAEVREFLKFIGALLGGGGRGAGWRPCGRGPGPGRPGPVEAVHFLPVLLTEVRG